MVAMKYTLLTLLYWILLFIVSGSLDLCALGNLRAELNLDLKAVEEFCRFCEYHSKTYDTINETIQRYYIYHENKKIVQELNLRSVSATFSAFHSPFGDVAKSEFKRKFLMSPRTKPETVFSNSSSMNPYSVKRMLTQNIGSSTFNTTGHFDWTTKNAVTPVKNQGSLGTCWAFSAIGVIEGQLAIKHKTLTNLSVEQLVECDHSRNRTSGDADCSEFGGWPLLAFEYMRSFGGVYTEEQFPYCAGKIDSKTALPLCFPCMPKYYDKKSCGDHSDLYCNSSSTLGQGPRQYCAKIKPEDAAAKVDSYRTLPSNETELAMELMMNGPIAVAMNALPLQFYHKGVFDPLLCNPWELNHAVLLVGYGIEQPSNKLYWKVKNSWGVKFGEDGFFRIARNRRKCGINRAASIASIK